MAEEKEEKEGIEWGEMFGHAIKFMILTWSLSMMTLDIWIRLKRWSVFSWLDPVRSVRLYGISVNKKEGQTNAAKIVDNKDTKVGIK